jgi:hypothetical protein
MIPGMWWSTTVPTGGERPEAGVKLGSWNGEVLGDRVAKERAKAVADAYLSAGGSGKPKLVKSRRRLEDSPDLTYMDEAISAMGDVVQAEFGTGLRADGSRDTVPAWLAWQCAKFQIASIAGVMDEPALEAKAAARAAPRGTVADEEARARYGAELDRVISANHLAGAVTSVHDAFFGPDPPA